MKTKDKQREPITLDIPSKGKIAFSNVMNAVCLFLYVMAVVRNGAEGCVAAVIGFANAAMWCALCWLTEVKHQVLLEWLSDLFLRSVESTRACAQDDAGEYGWPEKKED